MRMNEFGISDTAAAAFGVSGIVWMVAVYVESLRRYKIRRAIFKKYPNGIIWQGTLFTNQLDFGTRDFDVDRVDAVSVEESSMTGYKDYMFSDVDIEYTLKQPNSAGA